VELKAGRALTMVLAMMAEVKMVKMACMFANVVV
jgi:N-acetylmuramic acid 6-phosphate (MurNAc-6-P) etherase